jgi:Ribbon-helix-helix protein, copG family
MGNFVKTSMNLPEDSLKTLRKLADDSNVTMAEVIRRAVATERFLRETIASGGKILIKDKNGDSLRELLIR